MRVDDKWNKANRRFNIALINFTFTLNMQLKNIPRHKAVLKRALPICILSIRRQVDVTKKIN